jgi:hypothetical protein
MTEIIEYAKQEVKDGFIKSYWIDDGKVYAESDQGIFIYWQEEQTEPVTLYGE